MKKKLYKVMLFIGMYFFSVQMQAQVRIGGANQPNQGAVLDLNADDTKTGFLGLALPRVSLSNTTSWQLNGNDHIEGMMIYNTNAAIGKGVYVWLGDDTGWSAIAVQKNTVKPNPNPNLTVIDLLVVYTPAAKALAEQNGGINHIIDLGLEQANKVMENSKTDVVFNLVHAQEIDYTESNNINTDLARLKKVNDGYADAAHVLRNRYKADLVTLLVGEASSGVSGAGFILRDKGGNSKGGFSVVKAQSIISNGYTMIHELGHNFGCGHHMDTDAEGLNPSSHGWRGTSAKGNKFSTIMTYEYMNGENSPRIPYFSDPNASFEGTPIGDVDKGNNVATINQTKQAIAAYSEELEWMDAFLKDIVISAGKLSPAFDPCVKNYTVEVDNSVTTINVEGIANSPHASVTGNVTGKSLTTGDNPIEIRSIDGWGNYEMIYTVTVKRKTL